MFRFFLAFAAINGFLSVALGAFGAHALKSSLPENLLATFNTAVDYQVAHSLALIFVVVLAKFTEQCAQSDQETSGLSTLKFSGWAFAIGILLFSGSLYALILSGQTFLGAITPIGGLSFLSGWGALVAFSLRKTN